MNSAEIFDEHRSFLFSVAYRMLGSVMDAEDIVQETYVRWSQSTADVASPKAYLTTIATNLSLNYLQSARVRREQYTGTWLPEPLVTGASADPADKAALAHSLSFAFLTLLERLSPTERAVFLLREVFDYEYEEIAPVVGKTTANCRQLAKRARKHITDHRPRFSASNERHEQLLKQFLQTCSTGDLEAMVSLLAEDAVLYADGGGEAKAPYKPIYGADKIARFFLAIMDKVNLPEMSPLMREVNAQPGLVSYLDGRPISFLTIGAKGSRIQDIYVVANPHKLASLKL